mgnify:FL=1
MKILITGGAGFIGSNLVRRYTNQENEIVIIDNFCTGKMSNIEDIVKQKNVKFFKKDICDEKIIDFIRKSKFDYIYNLACPASPKYYLKFPIETWEASVLGVRNILNAIKGTSTRLLQTSTSEVYGSAKEIPQEESYWGNVNCYGVRACYDEGKRSAETLIFDYKRLFNVDARIVRIFNTYGQGMDKNDGRVIANFMNQAINNEDITIYGDGNQTRSFCYIEDTIDAIIKIMNKKENVETPINIGNPVEVTIKEIANMIKNITGSKSNIKFCEANKDDPPRRKPDINKAINEIGWKPKIELEYGLKKCLEYYIDQNKSI